jgi:hypothetical protein
MPQIGRSTTQSGGVDLPAMRCSLLCEAAYEGGGFGLIFAATTAAHKTLTLGSNCD